MDIEAIIARHLSWLTELGELGMDVARRTGSEAAADDATPAQILSFDRAARAVRGSIDAEARLVREHVARNRPDRRDMGRGGAASHRPPARLGAAAAIAAGTWKDPVRRTETDELVGVRLMDIIEQVSERVGVRPDIYGWSDEELHRTFRPMEPLETDEAPVDEVSVDEAVDGAVADEASADEAVAHEAPADEAVADEASADEAVADEAVAGEPLADGALAGEAVAGEPLADATPADASGPDPP